MKKERLRSLGLGFLIAAIIVAAFAIFVQGYVPAGNAKVNSLFSNEDHQAQITSLEEEISAIDADRQSLTQTRNQLNEAISSMAEDNKNKDDEIASLEDQVRALQRGEDESDDSEQVGTSDESTEEATNEDGSFTIESGMGAEAIGQALVDEGYLDTADEFNQLVSEWGLEAYIQEGSYEIQAGMTVHDILEEITNGAYYYN